MLNVVNTGLYCPLLNSPEMTPGDFYAEGNKHNAQQSV